MCETPNLFGIFIAFIWNFSNNFVPLRYNLRAYLCKVKTWNCDN